MDETSSKIQLASEIAWCVEQLETSLSSGKLSEKKLKEARKSKKVLQNPDTPLVKLRQIMRINFGDFRAKMRSDEEKHKMLDTSKVKLASVPATKTTSSFIKKRSEKVGDSTVPKATFKFNFSDQNDQPDN